MAAGTKGSNPPKRQPKGDYPVGYARPPKQKQFKPGVSGNPNGRPKGTKNIATELQEILAEQVETRSGEKRTKSTLRKTIWRKHAYMAANGDVRSFNALVAVLSRAGLLNDESESAPAAKITESDEALIADYLRRATANPDNDPEA